MDIVKNDVMIQNDQLKNGHCGGKVNIWLDQEGIITTDLSIGNNHKNVILSSVLGVFLLYKL